MPMRHPTDNRKKMAARLVIDLIESGKFAISPALYGSVLIDEAERGTWDFWKQYCQMCVQSCGKVLVANVDGWKESQGVQDEIAYAKSLGLKVSLIDINTLKSLKSL